jgi:hypothetical protein
MLCSCGLGRVASFAGPPMGHQRAVDLSAERVAKNDAVFRNANEGIERSAVEHGVAEGVPFLCECAEPSCTELLRLSLVDYEMVRAQPRWFINAPGHQVAGGKHVEVARQRDGYLIVEKLGRAGEIVEELDPREAAGAEADGTH